MVLFVVPVVALRIERKGIAMVTSFDAVVGEPAGPETTSTSLQMHPPGNSSQRTQLASGALRLAVGGSSSGLMPISLQMHDIEAVSSHKPHEVDVEGARGAM